MLTAIPQQTQTRYVTDKNATYTNVRTLRYRVRARLFENCLATDTIQEFDVLVRQEVWANSQLSRILKRALGMDWRSEDAQLAQEVCAAF